MNKITRLAAALVLSGLLLAAPAAQAAPSLLGQSSNFELEVSEMELEITALRDMYRKVRYGEKEETEALKREAREIYKKVKKKASER